MCRNILVDKNLCIGCGLCVKGCPAKVFELVLREDSSESDNDKKIASVIHPENCIECTHCMALCPTKAVHVDGYDYNQIINLSEKKATYNELLPLMNGRRSYRNYKDKAVEDEIIEKIMDAMKNAPTGENAQELEYFIIRNREILKKIAKKMGSVFKFLNILVNKLGFKLLIRLSEGKEEAERLSLSLKGIVEDYLAGNDPFLYNAPVFIIITAKEKTAMMNLDAGIAGHQLNLLAESLGLGCCWIGYFVVISKYLKSIYRICGIPKKHRILASMVVGYPSFYFKRSCARKPLSINYR